MKTLMEKLAIFIVLLSLGCNKVINTSTESFIKKILPPIPNVNIGFDKYLVDAQQGGIINHKTGTLIKVPENAFVDKTGKTIKGNVEVKPVETDFPANPTPAGAPVEKKS